MRRSHLDVHVVHGGQLLLELHNRFHSHHSRTEMHHASCILHWSGKLFYTFHIEEVAERFAGKSDKQILVVGHQAVELRLKKVEICQHCSKE